MRWTVWALAILMAGVLGFGQLLGEKAANNDGSVPWPTVITSSRDCTPGCFCGPNYICCLNEICVDWDWVPCEPCTSLCTAACLVGCAAVCVIPESTFAGFSCGVGCGAICLWVCGYCGECRVCRDYDYDLQCRYYDNLPPQPFHTLTMY